MGIETMSRLLAKILAKKDCKRQIHLLFGFEKILNQQNPFWRNP
jgi:hypothetical protein